jgi:hypothetical protein
VNWCWSFSNFFKHHNYKYFITFWFITWFLGKVKNVDAFWSSMIVLFKNAVPNRIWLVHERTSWASSLKLNVIIIHLHGWMISMDHECNFYMDEFHLWIGLNK